MTPLTLEVMIRHHHVREKMPHLRRHTAEWTSVLRRMCRQLHPLSLVKITNLPGQQKHLAAAPVHIPKNGQGFRPRVFLHHMLVRAGNETLGIRLLLITTILPNQTTVGHINVPARAARLFARPTVRTPAIGRIQDPGYHHGETTLMKDAVNRAGTDCHLVRIFNPVSTRSPSLAVAWTLVSRLM